MDIATILGGVTDAITAQVADISPALVIAFGIAVGFTMLFIGYRLVMKAVSKVRG